MVRAGLGSPTSSLLTAMEEWKKKTSCSGLAEGGWRWAVKVVVRNWIASLRKDS